MGVGLRHTAKAVDLPPTPNVHAPQIYPDLGQRHIELDRSPQPLAAYSFNPQPKEAAEQVGPVCRTGPVPAKALADTRSRPADGTHLDATLCCRYLSGLLRLRVKRPAEQPAN